MTQYSIVTDLNRCVGCLACSVACKAVNDVPIGDFWLKVLRVGPNSEKKGSTDINDMYMYFLPVQCQHCKDPECVKVCPTGASHKLPDGTVQVDKEKCIGCQFCAMSCPYGVRYLNEEKGVVEKCTLCEQKISQGELPQCVAQCGGNARYFGDANGNIRDFKGAEDGDGTYRTLGSFCEEFKDSDVHHLPNVGNGPAFAYILRGHEWKGKE